MVVIEQTKEPDAVVPAVVAAKTASAAKRKRNIDKVFMNDDDDDCGDLNMETISALPAVLSRKKSGVTVNKFQTAVIYYQNNITKQVNCNLSSNSQSSVPLFCNKSILASTTRKSAGGMFLHAAAGSSSYDSPIQSTKESLVDIKVSNTSLFAAVDELESGLLLG